MRLGLCLVGGALALGLFAGCAEDSTQEDPVVEGRVEWPLMECDMLVESACMLPFPSNVFTVRDDSMPTGRRLQLAPAAMPDPYYGIGAAPDPWNTLDGFSPGTQIMAHLPGVTPDSLSDLPSSITIERSLEDDCPTILIDAETDERIPHWVDLDMTGERDDQRMLMIRPAIRLEHDRRYIVGIAGFEDTPEASPAFRELRDELPSDEPSIRARRGLYADIFDHLEEAGAVREDLILAWDFSTSSREETTRRMLHMRDEALAAVGPAGPQFEVVQVDTNFEPENIAAKLLLLMTVPLYLDKPGTGSNMVYGADGQPDPNPDQPTAQYLVEVLIPHSATAQNPAAIMQYGHGLLGEKEQIRSSHFLSFVNEYNYVLFGVDFVGMADEDELHIGNMIASGRLDIWKTAVDRQHQGMLNSLLAMRMMIGGFSQHPDYGPLVDPSRAYYHGISQGGIFGGTYMALTTDVERGVLGVMGMPYNVLLARSVDFDLFFGFVRATYPDSQLDHMLLIEFVQMLWDRTEPNGYAPYILENMLPGTPSHEVFMRAALGDHQVTTLGAGIMARSMGIPIVDSGQDEVYGLETVSAPVEGTGLMFYDLGLPPDPVENLPQRECEDPHGAVRKLEAARMQLDDYLRTGVINNHCPGGVCDFHDMSGCGAAPD